MYEAGFGRDRGRAFAHVPLQGFGDTLIRRRRNKIQTVEERRICLCWCIALPDSVSVCVMCSCMGWLPTRVRSHFTVMSYIPETSGSRSCDGDGDGLPSLFQIYSFGLLLFCYLSLNTHTVRTVHARVNQQFTARTLTVVANSHLRCSKSICLSVSLSTRRVSCLFMLRSEKQTRMSNSRS